MSQNQQIILWPYISETPYIDFTIGNGRIFFHSLRNNEFTIYDNLRINIEETNKYLYNPEDHIKQGDMPEQPEYAFIISNGESQLRFMKNCNRLGLSILDGDDNYTSHINIECDVTYGDAFKDLLTGQFTPHKMNIIETKQTVIKPFSSWVHYDCISTLYQKNERDFGDEGIS